MTPRKALGRGLAALIPEPTTRRTKGAADDYFLCPIESIKPAPHQPRQLFDDAKLAELVTSLREHGLVQPLVVRPGGGRNSYVLIAGERRWRAAQKAGLRDVPVVIRKVSDQAAFELALVENLQREDLNAIEEAEAYQHLVDEHSYSAQQLAGRVGKDRSTVANSLRLLKLPERARRALIADEITSGHARALLALERARPIQQALREVLKRKLSVRQTEALVKAMLQQQRDGDQPKKAQSDGRSANIRDLEERMMRSLKTRVSLRHRDKSGDGRVEIHYGSLDELDRLLKVLLK